MFSYVERRCILYGVKNMADKKDKGGSRWIQELETKDTVQESEGTFAETNSAEEIAVELKRKAPTFQSAVGKITLYLNRAGKRLSKSRRKELERVPVILRELYNRKDRQRANKDRPLKVDIKKEASISKVGAIHGQWYDEAGKRHYGDQFLELLLADKESVRKLHPEVNWEDLEEYRDWILDHYFHQAPKDEDKRKQLLEKAKEHMFDSFKQGIDVPFWEYKGRFDPHNFVVVPRVASAYIEKNDGDELIFANQSEAIQLLSDILGEKVLID